MTGASPARSRRGARGKALVLALFLLLGAAPRVRAQDRRAPALRPPSGARALADGGPRDKIPPFPYRVGEELTFDLTWMGIKGGTARMAVREKTTWAGTPVYHLVTTAESSPLVSAFYRVEDRIDSFVDSRGLFPLFFQSRQREGKYRGSKDIIFNPARGKATYRKNRDPVEVFSVPPKVQDALSSFYYLRTLPLKPGESLRIETFDSKKTWSVEVRVLGREVLNTPWGRVEALEVKPRLKFQGIFRHKGDILIWLSEDFQHLPLRMESKVAIGSIAATLVQIRGAKPPVPAR